MSFADDLINAANTELAWWNSAGCSECQLPCRARVGTYWAIVGQPTWDGCTAEPWSAAFICYCMDQAGMPRDQFPYADGHWVYIEWAYQNEIQNLPGKSYYLERASAYAPKPGDMVALWRVNRITYDTIPTTHFTGHCNIVVSVGNGQVRTIGGNVSNKVKVTNYACDQNGLVLNPDAQQIIGIMRCART